MLDRFTYALIGFAFGALVGTLCWWLYGLGFSTTWSGPGIDPALGHWIRYAGGTFAVLGFLLRDRVGEVLGDVIGALFAIESAADSRFSVPTWLAVAVLALIVAAVWFNFQ